LAVEHGLVPHEGGDLSGGGEGGGEGAALEAELPVFLLVGEVALETGNVGFEVVELTLEASDQVVAEVRGGKIAGRREDVSGDGVEVGTGFLRGGRVAEVGEAMEELQVGTMAFGSGLGVGEGVFQVLEALFGFKVVAVTFVEGFADGTGLEALGAAQSPEAGGDAVDEHPLDNVAGVEVVVQLAK
jgi:hypothetical protein